MPRRGQFKPKAPKLGDGDPGGVVARIAEFIDWMRIKGYAESTLETRGKYLAWFARWLEERGITRPQDVTKPTLDCYQRYLYHYRKADGDPLTFSSQGAQIIPIRAFFRWLARSNYILSNPASEMELPKTGTRLPRNILTVQEAEKVLAQPNLKDPLGIRDRAILETFYSIGIRRAELSNLKIFDLDRERGTIMIREGKGKKDRMLPIGERALAWIKKYLEEVRPSWVVEPDSKHMFLTFEGKDIMPDTLTELVKDYVNAADIEKKGSCHMFRHTMATLMLEGGADIRFIQQMLGHAKLDTTELYTQVSIRKLKEVFDKTHPGAHLKRERKEEELTEEEPNPEVTKENLLSLLAAEEKEENS